MGAQVGQVPRGAGVKVSTPHAQFGRWFRQQRELRGISVWFVAARTKLPPERIQALEDGISSLGNDGHARATARGLARAIGADPGEAVAKLSRRRRGSSGDRRSGAWRAGLLAWGPHASVALVLGLVAWVLASWLLSYGPGEESPPLVYRTDYLERLLPRGDGS